MRVRLTSAAHEVARKTLNLEDVRVAAVPLASVDEQQEILQQVAEKLSQIEAAAVAIDHCLIRAARLRQSILKQAFEGKLVPQDPHDESASVLLERIRVALPLPTPSRNGDNARVRGPTRSHPKGGAKRPKGGVG
jgi:type I restriction enzyme, S subunit